MSERIKAHGIEDAMYSLAADGKYHPRLICSCGAFGTDRFADSWEDAGSDLDEHLADTTTAEEVK